MENEKQSSTMENGRKEKTAGNQKIILGMIIGILLTLCLVGVFWSISTGRLFTRVNRADSVSTARGIAVAFLDKKHDNFMEFVPATRTIAFKSGWWENGEFIMGTLGCTGKSNELFRSRWLQGALQNYKIVDVLVRGTNSPNYKIVDVVIVYDGNQHVLKFWIENQSSRWWFDTTYGLCIE